MTASLVPTGHHRSHLTRVGRGDSVLFLHGSGPGATGMSNWSLASRTLHDDFDLLIPDLTALVRELNQPLSSGRSGQTA